MPNGGFAPGIHGRGSNLEDEAPEGQKSVVMLDQPLVLVIYKHTVNPTFLVVLVILAQPLFLVIFAQPFFLVILILSLSW